MTTLTTERLLLRPPTEEDIQPLLEMNATEAAAPLLGFAFAEAGLDRVVSIRHPENGRSGRVMEKLGLRLAGEEVVPAHGTRVVIHAITREEYAAARR